MNWDRDIMYWTANPQHKLVFTELYKGDTTKDKQRSACFMWGLSLLYNIESEIYDWRFDDRLEFVQKSIWKDYASDFKKMHEKYSTRMGRIDGGDTPGMRQLKEWNRIMDEKTKFISTQSYSKDTYRMLEEMLASNSKLFDEYERIEQILMKENIVGDKTRGGSEESLLEKSKL